MGGGTRSNFGRLRVGLGTVRAVLGARVLAIAGALSLPRSRFRAWIFCL